MIPVTRAADPFVLVRAIGNRAAASLLARDTPAGEAERTFTDPKSSRSVRRIRVDGVVGGFTDMAMAIIPSTLPKDGGTLDVLLFLHGHHVRGAHGYDKDKGGPKGAEREGDDIAFHQIPQQMAAAGKPIIGILPQGGHASEFNPSPKKGKGFNADDYVSSVFGRLTAMKAWGTPTPPVPGPVVLSGHSGADVAIDEMLAGELGPHMLRGLFLFDTMWPGKNYEVHIWKRIEFRLEQDLSELRGIEAQEDDRDRAGERMVTWVRENGFRLFVVFGADKDDVYEDTSRHLGELKDAWLRRSEVQRVIGKPGSPVYKAVAANLVVREGGGGHDFKLSAGHHLQTALEML
jgi:hypothetical protein